MAFLIDVQELKPGLIIFRRADVKHRNWYCRIKVPRADRYKSVSLKTADLDAAKEKAFDQDADVRFRIKHEVPIFNRPFSQVAKDYADLQKERVEAGEVTLKRTKSIDSALRVNLNRYIGTMQINLVTKDKWKGYPLWRQKTWREERERRIAAWDKAQAEGRPRGRYIRKDPHNLPEHVSDASIRVEMSLFRSIMAYAAEKKYVPESHIFKDKLPLSKVKRDEFRPEEYRKLHTFARGWVKKAPTSLAAWYRAVAYNFILIMCNTGMRPPEAKNLRWRDVSPVRADRQGREFIILHVRGKGKARDLVAAKHVADYIDRIRALSKATKPDDFVFTTIDGGPALALYRRVIETILTEAGLLISSSGKRRSTYCFRHTFATFRLMEGVDVYSLAQQMGTSVKMIEDHYGHITPVKNAALILQGLPGWEPVAVAAPEAAARNGRVNAAAIQHRTGKKSKQPPASE
jgi:integrase